MNYPALFIFVLLLSGCTAKSPAPVYEVDNLLIVEEKPEPKRQRPQNYIIRQGDTLASIALEYGLDYQELALWNGIANPDSIYTGDTLRLSPSPNAPSVAAIKPQKTAPIKAAAAATEPTLKPTAPAAKTPTPKSTIIGGAVESPALAGAQVPTKTAPLAVQYPYSAKTLKKLQVAHAATQKPNAATTPKPTATPKPPVVAAAQPAAITPATLQKSRRRFDVDWSWPATGKVILKFNESSKGLDIAGKKGDGVYAAADGKVVYVGTGVKSYGRLIILKHKNDYLSAYAHNDKILVKEGQNIARGQSIATIGDSGADNTMLHLEIRKAGKPFDPLQVLPSKR